jgi:hypothetical protein
MQFKIVVENIGGPIAESGSLTINDEEALTRQVTQWLERNGPLAMGDIIRIIDVGAQRLRDKLAVARMQRESKRPAVVLGDTDNHVFTYVDKGTHHENRNDDSDQPEG